MAERIWIVKDMGALSPAGFNTEFEKAYSDKKIREHKENTTLDHPNGSVTDEKLSLSALNVETDYGTVSISGGLTGLLEEILKRLIDLQGAVTTPQKTVKQLADDHENYESVLNKNTALGYAGLDGNSKISSAQLPEKRVIPGDGASYSNAFWYGEATNGATELFIDGKDDIRYFLGDGTLTNFSITVSAVKSDLSEEKTWIFEGSVISDDSSSTLVEPVTERVIAETENASLFTAGVSVSGKNLLINCTHLGSDPVICFAKGNFYTTETEEA